MTNLSFDHVHYRSSNFDKTKSFYIDTMNGVLLPPEELGGTTHLHIALGGVSMLFALSPEPFPIPVPADERLGTYHIAFLVENCKEATQYYEDRGATVAIQPKDYSDTITASFLEAPDGMWVELKEVHATKMKKK